MSKHRRRAHHWSTQDGMTLEHTVGNAAGARSRERHWSRMKHYSMQEGTIIWVSVKEINIALTIKCKLTAQVVGGVYNVRGI